MELYAWGANSHGQLGIGKQTEFVRTATKVCDIPENIRQVVGSGGHTFILDEFSNLWAAGWNNKGQLGITTSLDTCKFVNVHHKFKSVSCGWNSSAGISLDGRLFVWGSNNQNILGFSKKEHSNFLVPTELKLPLGETAEDIQFGLQHAVILTKKSQIFILGSFKHFKNVQHKIVVHNSTEYLHFVPRAKLQRIASGQNHILLLDCENSLYGIGDNRFLQCADLKPPENIIQIASGWTHNAFLSQKRELYLYGRNNYGQCGSGFRSEFEPPLKCLIQPVDEFKLGAEHGIFLSDGKVYSFGWNEHGNCGNGTFDDLLKPEMIELPTNGHVVGVYAGSGYSLVTTLK